MQTNEYNKLFEASALNDLPKTPPRLAFFGNMTPEAIKSLQELPAQEARQVIEKHETEMPEPMRRKIQMYVDRRRKAGASEKAIKKAVKKKFNITVV